MIHSYSKAITICFVILFSSSISLFAQPSATPNINDLLGKLTEAEHAQLMEHILSNTAVKNEVAVKNLFKSLSPESESLVRDYIMLVRNKDYVAPSNVEFSADTIDFGRVEVGSIVRDTVFFEVQEPAAYVITKYVSSCTHLGAKLPEYPSMPGQTGAIPIELNTRKLVEGPIRLLLSVRGNNGPNHRHFIYVKADLYSDINYSVQRP
jgi:hypothetical protein